MVFKISLGKDVQVKELQGPPEEVFIWNHPEIGYVTTAQDMSVTQLLSDTHHIAKATGLWDNNPGMEWGWNINPKQYPTPYLAKAMEEFITELGHRQSGMGPTAYGRYKNLLQRLKEVGLL